MGKGKRKADTFARGDARGIPENYRAPCQFEHFDRNASVSDVLMSIEAEKEAAFETENEGVQEGAFETKNEGVVGAENNSEGENISTENIARMDPDESDSTYVCGCDEETDDGSISDGGSDFDDEYASARQQRKNLRSNAIDSINGLGLDPMLDAPGGVASVNGKYWEGGAVGNLDAHAGCEESEPGSDYADTDDGLVTPSSSDEENLEIKKRKKRTRVYYNPKCNHEELQFKMFMVFTNKVQVKHAVQQWAICRGHDVRWPKSERLKVEAKCAKGCSWRLYASRKKSCTSFRITGLENKHTCQRASKNRQATSEWVAKEFIQRFRRQPSYKPKFMQGDLKEKYSGLVVPMSCCYRAKTIAMTIIRGSLETHYTRFRAYDAELKRVDSEGLFRFHFITDPESGLPIFQRYYVGFSGLRKGFRNGCRPVLCVDGCFLKTLVVGVLLSAVGRDANNQMYPVAWAIAETENEETWTWFMDLLISDLGFGDGLFLTLISDQQKGLKNAIRNVAPLAEHRNCARHIYANWKKKHKDPELKRLFWKAVNTTNIPEFNSVMELMKAEKHTAHEDFMKQLENIFCKAYVRPDIKCDAITSNLVETFNGYIAKARQLQAINMLEEIRTTLMERMSIKSELMNNHFESICPKIREKIDKNQIATRLCEAKLAKGAFQVSNGDDQYVVNLVSKTCTCRAWDISGIPCAHALVCINFMRYNVEDYVDDWYKREKYQKAYEFCIQPLNGLRMWPNVGGDAILPPPYRKLPGRPKKNRRRDPDEEPKKSARFARKGVAMTCTHCLVEGHNKRSCPKKDSAPAERPPKPASTDGNRYVSGAVSTAAAARRSNTHPNSSQKGSTTNDVARPVKSSQEGSSTTSVMFKSTASQAATPRVDKLPLQKGKQSMGQ